MSSPDEQAIALVTRIGKIAGESQILAMRYDGYMKLYAAACQAGNAVEIDQFRSLVLSTVEQILDNTAVQHMLARQVGEIKPT